MIKDYFGFLVIFTFFCFQIFFIIFSLSHPDNLLTINYVVTPLHIIPEWYFLTFYSILKSIPNKNTGFIVIIIILYILVLFGEFKYQIAEYTKLIRLWSLFIIFVLLLWIGCQLPQDLFIYYGRLCLYLYLIIISMHVTLFPGDEQNYSKIKMFRVIPSDRILCLIIKDNKII
jgi:ubiquinol-cytochrome c reductase cytochrome b subunit